MNDDLLTAFIEQRYTTELAQEFFKSLDIFDSYEYPKGYEPLYAMVGSVGVVDNEDLADHLYEELNNQLDIVLHKHGIQLSESATLDQRNDILYALSIVQHRECCQQYARILESDLENIEQVGSIIEDITQLPITDFYSIVTYMDPKLPEAILTMIDEQQPEQVTDTANPKVVRLLRIFSSHFGKDHLAASLIDGGFIIGAKLCNYLPFVEDDIVADDTRQTALNILSLLYLSEDTFENPVEAYREYSDSWMESLQTINQVETILLEMISKMTELLEIDDAINRLPTTSH